MLWFDLLVVLLEAFLGDDHPADRLEGDPGETLFSNFFSDVMRQDPSGTSCP